ncbi:hypothetical protein BTS2_0381 [Bacillus sp. TS-2]|nr:hypothetical protein BTS2_0381 [Bacillus sp. TS-2]
MEHTGVIGAIYHIADKLWKLAYVNLLWILFTLIGLVIFGFFPATISMFTILRKFVLKEKDFNIFKLFWETYKKELWKGNLLGLVFVILGIITCGNFIYFWVGQGHAELLFYPVVFVTILLLLTTFFVFPVYVHYDIHFLQTLKTSFIFMAQYPLSSLLMLIYSVILLLIIIILPAFSIFYGGSIAGLMVMVLANRVFNKNIKKLENPRA